MSGDSRYIPALYVFGADEYHLNMQIIGPLRGPFSVRHSPYATMTYGHRAAGFIQFKAAGLVQTFGLLCPQ